MRIIVNDIAAGSGGIDLSILWSIMVYGNINHRNMIAFIKMIDRFRLLSNINHGRNLLQPINREDLGKAYYQAFNNASIQNGDYILSED